MMTMLRRQAWMAKRLLSCVLWSVVLLIEPLRTAPLFKCKVRMRQPEDRNHRELKDWPLVVCLLFEARLRRQPEAQATDQERSDLVWGWLNGVTG